MVTRRGFLSRLLGVVGLPWLVTPSLPNGLVFHRDAFELTMRDLTEEDVRDMEDWAAEDKHERHYASGFYERIRPALTINRLPQTIRAILKAQST